MPISRREFLASAAAPLLARPKPNIIFILVDDLGYGDLGLTGNRDVPTPRMDSIGQQGVRFSQFYCAAPVCSPSRVGFTTGQFPARHLINTYLNSRKTDRENGMRDWLDPAAPCIARTFRDAGYATGHFGKWHMGGGRDVGDAPLPQEYGFQRSVTSFEGLGDRVLIENDNLSKQSAALGRGKIQWAPKYNLTQIYVDHAIEFMRANRNKPFFIHLWPCDVHDPYRPRPELMEKYKRFSANPYQQKFNAVLDDDDRQFGRLLDALDDMGVADNTIVALTGDNGPTAWPYYYKEGFTPPGSSGGFRGRKWSLYEGGIREPLLVRWKGTLPAGVVDESTIVGAVDIFPTLCGMAGIDPPHVKFDGEDMGAAFRGKRKQRSRPLYWEYGRTDAYQRPGLKEDQSPNVAIRDGRWKLLVNADGSQRELYDFQASQLERDNVAEAHPDVAKRLSEAALRWRKSLPELS
jgi:arylsulfatase A-like enzyme